MSITQTIYKSWKGSEDPIPDWYGDGSSDYCNPDTDLWTPVFSWNEKRTAALTVWFSKHLPVLRCGTNPSRQLRPISKGILEKLYADLQDLKKEITEIIPDFFPEGSDRLMYFEFVKALGSHIRHTFFASDGLADNTEYEKKFGTEPKILWYFTKVCEDSPEIREKLTALKLGNSPVAAGIGEPNTEFPFWVWQYAEAIGYLIGSWDIGWEDYDIFWADR